MTDNRITEALRSALRMEEESFLYYLESTAHLTDPGIITLLDTLAEDELGHVNRLLGILGEPPVGKDELTTELLKRRPRASWIIPTDPIPEVDDPVAVLESALKREEDTRRGYDMMATFTTLPRDFTGLCAFLSNEEREHGRVIRDRLAALRAP